MSAIFLDVSTLEAPEPLQQAISALEVLPFGDYLQLHHRIKPCHLYRYLDEHHFASDTRFAEGGDCEVFVWREGDTAAAQLAGQVASDYAPWVGD